MSIKFSKKMQICNNVFPQIQFETWWVADFGDYMNEYYGYIIRTFYCNDKVHIF